MCCVSSSRPRRYPLSGCPASSWIGPAMMICTQHPRARGLYVGALPPNDREAVSHTPHCAASEPTAACAAVAPRPRWQLLVQTATPTPCRTVPILHPPHNTHQARRFQLQIAPLVSPPSSRLYRAQSTTKTTRVPRKQPPNRIVQTARGLVRLQRTPSLLQVQPFRRSIINSPRSSWSLMTRCTALQTRNLRHSQKSC